METLTLPDGRTLEYLVEGPADGRPLIVHHGTPQGATRYAPVFDAGTRRGLRVVQYSRPGYAGSTTHEGRRVADAAADVTALLDTLGADDFVTVGWSGGGPHALACAALLPDRCRGAATIAGVAPYRGEGLNWLDGMGDENLEEFGAAAEGVPQLTAYLAGQAAVLENVRPDQVIEAFGDLLSAVDQQVLVGGFAGFLAESCRRAVSRGTDGWRDDDLAFLSDWGFALTGIQVPVAIWQGDQDRMVPLDHGRWLGSHVAGASLHLTPGEGHLSLIDNIDQILDSLEKH